MRPSRVRQRWDEGKPALCTLANLTDPTVCELIGLLGFDCIWIDMEHHATSVETAGHMMRAARVGGADVMARPGKGEFMRMARMLEAGAHGILYPRCDDADEAGQVVRWAKFAPLGERGFDSANADNPFTLTPAAEYVHQANRQTFVAIQIESPEAARHARAVAEVEGVDLVFFGPGDFSLLSGAPGGLYGNPATADACEQVCGETLAAGKHFGTLVFDLVQARRMLDLGATFIAYESDIDLLRAGFEQLRDQLGPLGFVFRSPSD